MCIASGVLSLIGNILRAVTPLLLLVGCADAVRPVDEPAGDLVVVEPPATTRADEQIDWMLQHADEYLNDREFRRETLEASLWRPDLRYASKRLDAYALDGRGWDLLPTFDVEVASVGPSPSTTSLDPTVPDSRAAWLDLGERVFWNMPMRRDAYLEWIIGEPELAREIGLEFDDDGAARGFVEFRDGYGDVRQGATCGLCHSSGGVPGAANEQLDLGRARALFGDQFGIDNSRYAEWGPGTVDVTDDEVGDALAIPSLWSIEYQSHLNTSGAIEVTTPAALAVRFETQFIVGHSMLERPHRVFVWALTMYVLSLETDTTPDTTGAGHEVFERACASCHLPTRAYGGPLVDASTINYDEQAANSVFRGTGFYRTPTLIGLSQARSFMHDGRIGSLEDLLLSGHPHGAVLDETDRRELVTFLESL